ERIGLGTSIVLVPLHNPMHLAKQVATLQELSGGRFTLGVGMGWHKDEYDFMGVEFRGRGRRADEAIRLMRELWSGERNFEGEYWSFHDATSQPHEIPYFQRYIERGQPALDVACGTGRLLLPYLRAGLDVDGCGVSADMVALCREKAELEGLSPTLWAQPMHELDPPRTYKTIFVCGAFGLGSTREHDFEALRRFRDDLEPGGTLLLDV